MTISVPLVVGGGIRTAQAAETVFEAGADFVVLGSIIERSKEQFKEIMRSLG
jgi:heptaprenylglyceryl phosphate synthase